MGLKGKCYKCRAQMGETYGGLCKPCRDEFSKKPWETLQLPEGGHMLSKAEVRRIANGRFRGQSGHAFWLKIDRIPKRELTKLLGGAPDEKEIDWEHWSAKDGKRVTDKIKVKIGWRIKYKQKW